MTNSTESLSTDELRTAIANFIKGYSVEATTHDLDRVCSYPEFIPAGTCVYVAHIPGAGIDDVIEMAGRLRRQGYEPVPHIVPRRLRSEAELTRALEQLREKDIDHVLVIAGDVPTPEGPYTCAMDILSTGLLEQHGIKTLGIPGHPEGNAVIKDKVLEEALDEKARFAADSTMDVHIVTQFGFDTTAIPAWEAAICKRGITLPIHVGMAGPTTLKRLMDLSVRCGIGASLRMLTKRTRAVTNMLKVSGPDRIITAYAGYLAANPDSRVERAHFFALGGVEKTAKWANAVVEGRITLNKDESGFEVQV
ncbi:MAG: hypothetical protein WD750_03585 [Gammaproteobacteria bacterium]